MKMKESKHFELHPSLLAASCPDLAYLRKDHWPLQSVTSPVAGDAGISPSMCAGFLPQAVQRAPAVECGRQVTRIHIKLRICRAK